MIRVSLFFMKIPNRTLQRMKKTTTRVDEVSTDPVEAMLSVESAMNAKLINRSRSVRALILAIVSKHNILLEGPPGTAKTLTGALFASAVQGDFTFFKTQMLKSSLPEQLFGPININKMRGENPIYEYHTDGMLPAAHLAIIEEVYRASEMVLSAMLTILNEKLFHNGGRTVKCPLMTAIGTTNFVTTGEEIEAFNDRWLIRTKIEPMTSATHRRQMYDIALSGASAMEADIELSQIIELQELARNVSFPSLVLDLYERLVAQMMTDSSIALTDRRQVQVLDLVKAAAALRRADEASPEDLIATEYGLTLSGDPKAGAAFANAYSTVVGNYEKMKSEVAELDALRQRYEKYVSVYDEKMAKDRAKKLQEVCRKMIDVMGRRTEVYSTQKNEDEYQRIMSRTEELLRDVTDNCLS
jgi:MoxR-like ATPase